MGIQSLLIIKLKRELAAEFSLLKALLSQDEIDDLFEIKQIALTKQQIRKYNPPPNPAKLTDTRSPNYIAEHGKVSWEVDALPPEVLHKVLEEAVKKKLDLAQYSKILSRESKQKKEIKLFIDKYENEG